MCCFFPVLHNKLLCKDIPPFIQPSDTGVKLFIFELMQSLSWIWWKKKVKLLSVLSPQSLRIFPHESSCWCYVVQCQRRGHTNICKTVRVSASVTCVCVSGYRCRDDMLEETTWESKISLTDQFVTGEKEKKIECQCLKEAGKCVNNLIQPKT